MRYEDQRKLMIENHIKKRGIKNPVLLAAFMKVPREEFVPMELREFTYGDHPLSIGDDQTISQPYIVALMMDLLDIQKTDKVLEIGTGSGYQTALLAEVAGSVYTVERIENLARKSRSILQEMKYTNIYYRVGDGTRGWEKAYPPEKLFDKIVVSAASPKVPSFLVDQLADKGKLILPIGNKLSQDLILIERSGSKVHESRFGGCTFVPLIGEEGWQNT